MNLNMKIRINRDTLLALVMFFFLCFKSIRVIIANVFDSGPISYAIMFFFLYASLLLYMSYSKRGLPKQFVAIFGCALVFFIITCFEHPEYHNLFFNESSDEETSRLIVNQIFNFQNGVFALLFFCLYDDSEKLWKCLTFSSFVNVVFYMLRIFTGSYSMTGSLITQSGSYSMALGYDLLIPMFVFIVQALNSKTLFKKILYFVLSIVLFYFILSMGSRGALLCVIIYLFMYVMYISEHKYRRTTKFLIVTATLVIVYLCLNTHIIQMIGQFLVDNGIESRTVLSMLESSLTEENGREVRWLKAVVLIQEGGPFGYGFCASRYLYAGDYPHNILLEILVDMGYLGGGFIIILLIFGMIHTLCTVKDKGWRMLFVMYFSCAIGRLFVSGSFYSDTNFWATIAIGCAALSCIKHRKLSFDSTTTHGFI